MNYGGFSKSTVFQCARSLLLLLFSCRTRGLCNSRKPQSTFSDGSTQLNISSPHIGFYQSGLTLILSLGNVHNSYIHRVIDTLPVIRLAVTGDFEDVPFFSCSRSLILRTVDSRNLRFSRVPGVWPGLRRISRNLRFSRVPGVWPGLRRISRNLRFSACARSLAWT